MAIIAAFFLAGIVKGVTGMGLVLVSLALLNLVTDLPSAIALFLVPALATNLWQAFAGGNIKSVLKRIWPFLITALVTIMLGAAALRMADHALLSILLGSLIIVYSTVGLAGIKFRVHPAHNFWIGPLLGAINGIFTGMTGAFMVPAVMYFQALGLSRKSLMQGLGMLFSLSTVVLAVALKNNQYLTWEHGIWSLAGLIPSLAGMFLGQRFRRMLTENIFKRVFFITLMVLGIHVIIHSVGNFFNV